MSTYNNLGATLAHNHYLEQGMNYLRKALPLIILQKDTNLLALNYTNMAKANESKGLNDSALFFYEKALLLYHNTGRNEKILETMSNIGWSIGKQKKYQHAKMYFDSILTLYPVESRNDVGIQMGIGNIKMAINDFSAAIPHLKRVVELYDEQGLVLAQPTVYLNLAECYYLTGNKDTAYNYLMFYTLHRDSLIKSEKIQAISQMEVKYRTAEKEKELIAKELLLTKRDSQVKTRNLTILAISSISIALGGFLVSLYRRHKHKQKLQSEKLKRIEEQEKNKLLLAQMEGVEQERTRIAEELHDGIGGMLAAVKMNFSILRDKNKGMETSRYFQEAFHLLDDTAGALRKTAHNLMPARLQQQSLETALKAYCKKIQVAQQLVIEFQSYGMVNHSLNEALKRIVFLTVQELLQNVLKHAKASHVLVQLSLRDKLLHITVEDNGIGMQPVQAGHTDGMGLNTLKERVKAFGGSFEFETEPEKGTTVYMEFEIQS